jgi:predicted nucleic acid-binding protein
VRAYADSSFIVRLITTEPGSPDTVAAYRQLGKPALFFLPLHLLEVRNAILQRAFHQRRSASSDERRHAARERDAAFARLEHLLVRQTLLDVTVDMETSLTHAAKLSTAHTERLGARAIDLLHVSCALELESELFLTTDQRQARLARVEGMKVVSPG